MRITIITVLVHFLSLVIDHNPGYDLKPGLWSITIGAELGGAAGACAPPLLHNPRNFIVKMGWKYPEIPSLHPVVHLHYLEHFGASVYNQG